MRRTIPHTAYLIPDRVEWGEVLAEIWDNPFARLHRRKAFRHIGGVQRPMQDLPDGFELALVDQKLLDRGDAVDIETITDYLESWSSSDVFLRHTIGYCVIHDGAVISHCLADSVTSDRCELGVGTEEAYRGRGLGALVTRHAVARCLERGIRDRQPARARQRAQQHGIDDTAGFLGGLVHVEQDLRPAALLHRSGLGCALFLLIIKSVINEEEKAGAMQAQKTLRIAENTLTYLRNGLTTDSAKVVCHILHNEMNT
uniref:GNAT family N-acetyltransferase n=1 Tax=Devosia sp. TaxID=1871048 RepID=UPI002FC66F7A